MRAASGAGVAVALGVRQLVAQVMALESIPAEQLVLVGVDEAGMAVVHGPAMEKLEPVDAMGLIRVFALLQVLGERW